MEGQGEIEFRSSYRDYPVRLRVGLVGLGALAIVTWVAFWLRVSSDPRYGPMVTVATALIVPGVPTLTVLFLSGKVWAHRYRVDVRGIEVDQGARHHRMPADEIVTIALVHHHSETFAGFVNRRQRGILLGRGLAPRDLDTLIRWTEQFASARGVAVSNGVSVREFRKMASAGLAYGLPF